MSATFIRGNAAEVSNGPSVGAAFPGSGNDLANFLIVACMWQNSIGSPTFVSIQDTQTNSYSQLGTELTASSGNWKLRIYKVDSCKAGANTVSFTLSNSSTNNLKIAFAEFVGPQVIPVDNSLLFAAAGNTTAFSIGPLAIARTGETIITIAAQPSAGRTFTPQTGFTARVTSSLPALFISSNDNFSGSGSQTFTGTWNLSSISFGAVVALSAPPSANQRVLVGVGR